MMRIAIDAGHGPHTLGKRTPDGSMREYQFNSAVARYLIADLKKYNNVDILETFSDARDIPLEDRTKSANQWKADLFLSIHANAWGDTWSTANGIETYVYTSKPKEATELATVIQQNLVYATGLRDRGVKTADFHVLRKTNMTAVLIEHPFMSNREEAELLKSEAFRKKCANAILKSLVDFYQLSLNHVPWQATVGNEAAQYLEQAGIIDSAKAWEGAMLDKADIWFVFELLRKYDLIRRS